VNPSTLAVLVLSSAICGTAQPAENKVGARHVIGLENIKRNSAGKLTIDKSDKNVMRFETGTKSAEVPIASIDGISIGSEATQGGGKAGRAAKTAAIAAPYDSGAALHILLRTNVDILSVSYRDSGGGLHYAIVALPKGQGEQQRAQLTAAGAHVSDPAGEPKQAKPPASGAPTVNGQKLSASAIQIEPVDAGDVRIPAEFRAAVYEFLLERVRESGKFQQVFRSGDRAAAGVPDLVTLHTTVEKFTQGSQLKREVTTVLGATKVDVSASVTARDGHPLWDRRVQGKVRFFGENLGVTNDLAKRIAELLSKK
jgi:hypothetical protein